MSDKDCKNHEQNVERCNCTYPSCPRKGYCCECLHYHRNHGELPACFFSPEVESTYDRSLRRFLSLQALV